MTDLASLAARCEAADGGEAAILYKAWNMIARTDATFRRFACTAIDATGTTQAGRFAALVDAGAYLDAAMTLVPEWYRLQLSDWDDETLRTHGPWQAILTPPGRRCDFSEWMPRCDHAATPALALCAAALRARAMEANDGK